MLVLVDPLLQMERGKKIHGLPLKCSSTAVKEYWVRAIFLERMFTIKSVFPGKLTIAGATGIQDFLLDRGSTGMIANRRIIC
jgi:hypothetical protein